MQKFFLSLVFLLFFPAVVSASEGYEIIDGIVYYGALPVDSALADSFTIINKDKARDNNFCFFRNQKLANCHPGSFDALTGSYSKDANLVYFEGKKIEGADASTFRALSEEFARDRIKAYFLGQVIPGAASDSFEIISNGYAKDRNGVYQGLNKINSVDPATFAIINSDYYKDKDKVFYKGEAVEGAHPGSFRMMASEYARDANYFYRYGKAVAKSTNKYYERFTEKNLAGTCLPESVASSSEPALSAIGNGFSKDEYCVYYQMELIENSHPASFIVLNDKIAKDKNFVYLLDSEGFRAVPFASGATFIPLGGKYFRDMYVVYFGDNLDIINGADIDSFKVVCESANCTYEAEDKNRYYLNGLEVGLDEATKQLIEEAKLVYGSADNIIHLVNYNGVTRDLAKERETNEKYVKNMIIGVRDLEERSKNVIINFVLYGTHLTRALGAGERAGAVNSYKAAFGKLPQTEQDWADVFKVANGRWPTERNEVAEERANRRFRYIYHREPYSFDQNDQAAITIIAYGLRNRVRNTDSEKAAILTFRKMFSDYPSSASDWDMVRAIAYSGASR